jgi:division protein CdvB (Snf7/Vps24/ESCRT-III family)
MSIGIGDTVADVVTGAKIGEIIDKAKEEVKRIIEQYQVRLRIALQTTCRPVNFVTGTGSKACKMQ